MVLGPRMFVTYWFNITDLGYAVNSLTSPDLFLYFLIPTLAESSRQQL